MPETPTIPPQWFCQRAKFRRILRAAVRAIARDFSIRCAAKARKIDVDFRVASPPKRAKFKAHRARLQAKQLKQEVAKIAEGLRIPVSFNALCGLCVLLFHFEKTSS
jgi:hypothetical protein